MDHDTILLKVCFNEKNHIRQRFLNHLKKNDIPNIVEYLNSRYKDTSGYKETLHRMLHKVEERPRCLTCGKPIQWHGYFPFARFCNEKCASNNDVVKNKRKKTLLEEYGVEHNFQREDVKAKICGTMVHRYGKTVYTKSDRFQTQVYSRNEKSKTTNQAKYGCDWASQSEEVKMKIQMTNLERYGVDNPLKNPEVQMKKTKSMIEKYGIDNVFNSDGVQKKIQGKIKELYGDTCYARSEHWKARQEEIQSKIYKTKKKNKTFSSSSPEDHAYKILKERWVDVVRQYKSKEYPWSCDFYIPSIDLYIEFNCHWTHGDHPYDHIIDEEKINVWTCKMNEGHKYYKKAINTYTITDVKKRETAKQNRLNWIEFFSYVIKRDDDRILNEIESYVNSIFDNRNIRSVL